MCILLELNSVILRQESYNSHTYSVRAGRAIGTFPIITACAFFFWEFGCGCCGVGGYFMVGHTDISGLPRAHQETCCYKQYYISICAFLTSVVDVIVHTTRVRTMRTSYVARGKKESASSTDGVEQILRCRPRCCSRTNMWNFFSGLWLCI